MVTVLRSPWQGFGRKPAADGTRQMHTARTAEPATAAAPQARKTDLTSRRSADASKPRAPYAIPQFLESVPVSALRPASAPAAMRFAPTASGTISAGQYMAHHICEPSANSMQYPGMRWDSAIPLPEQRPSCPSWHGSTRACRATALSRSFANSRNLEWSG